MKTVSWLLVASVSLQALALSNFAYAGESCKQAREQFGSSEAAPKAECEAPGIDLCIFLERFNSEEPYDISLFGTVNGVGIYNERNTLLGYKDRSKNKLFHMRYSFLEGDREPEGITSITASASYDLSDATVTISKSWVEALTGTGQEYTAPCHVF